VLLAVVVALTLPELRRPRTKSETPSIPTVFRYLFGLRSFRHVSIASAYYAFVGYAVVGWMPTFLERSHGMTSGPIGTWLALIIGIGGAVGTLLGGRVADEYGGRDRRAYVFVPAVAQLLCLPFAFVVYLSDNTTLALVALTAPVLLGSMYQGPAFSVVQSLSSPAMRSTAAAVLLFVINILGLGLGPSAVGLLSDLLSEHAGENSLRYALLIVSLAYVASGIHFLLAARTLREDLAAVPRD
jgi:predicted MFS family arabinose efflux permease